MANIWDAIKNVFTPAKPQQPPVIYSDPKPWTVMHSAWQERRDEINPFTRKPVGDWLKRRD